jgi:hypothetical protein
MGNAGVADQHFDAAERLYRASDTAGAVMLPAEVADFGDRRYPSRLQIGTQASQRGGVAIQRDDSRPRCTEAKAQSAHVRG